MTMASTAVAEIRPSTGSNNFSGFFNPVSGAGTDYTQQGSAHVVFDGSTIAATTSGASATITITGYTVLATDVRNTVRISGGSSFLTGLYEISSVNTGSNTWTFTATCSSGSASGMTGNMGGALATIPQFETDRTGGNTGWVKAEATIGVTASLTINGTNGTIGAPNNLIGYSTIRGDNGQVTVQLSTTTAIAVMTVSSAATRVSNFLVDAQNLTSSIGIQTATNINIHFVNVKAINVKANGIGLRTNSCAAIGCEVTATLSSGGSGITTNGGNFAFVKGCKVHDLGASNVVGILIRGNAFVINNQVWNITGGACMTEDVNGCSVIRHNVFYNAVSGYSCTAASGLMPTELRDNIFHTITGTALTMAATTAMNPLPEFDGNMFFNCGTNRTRADNTLTGGIAWVNVDDTQLTSNPFMDPANANFALNNIEGGGMLVQTNAVHAWSRPVPYKYNRHTRRRLN